MNADGPQVYTTGQVGVHPSWGTGQLGHYPSSGGGDSPFVDVQTQDAAGLELARDHLIEVMEDRDFAAAAKLDTCGQTPVEMATVLAEFEAQSEAIGGPTYDQSMEDTEFLFAEVSANGTGTTHTRAREGSDTAKFVGTELEVVEWIYTGGVWLVTTGC